MSCWGTAPDVIIDKSFQCLRTQRCCQHGTRKMLRKAVGELSSPITTMHHVQGSQQSETKHSGFLGIFRGKFKDPQSSIVIKFGHFGPPPKWLSVCDMRLNRKLFVRIKQQRLQVKKKFLTIPSQCKLIGCNLNLCTLLASASSTGSIAYSSRQTQSIPCALERNLAWIPFASMWKWRKKLWQHW